MAEIRMRGMDGEHTAERRLMACVARDGTPVDGWIERMRRMDMDGDGWRTHGGTPADGMRGGMPADGWIERMRRMDMGGDGWRTHGGTPADA
jgi:hypothetical protein